MLFPASLSPPSPWGCSLPSLPVLPPGSRGSGSGAVAGRAGLRLFPHCSWPRPSKALKLCLLEASHLGLACPAWAQGQGFQGFGERSPLGILRCSGGTWRCLVPRGGSVAFVPQVLGVLVTARASFEVLLPTSSAVGRDGACQVCPAMGQILFLRSRGRPAWAEGSARLPAVVTTVAGPASRAVMWHRHRDKVAPAECGLEIRRLLALGRRKFCHPFSLLLPGTTFHPRLRWSSLI